MIRTKLSQWALIAVGAIGANTALADAPRGSHPASQSYTSEIQLVSHCEGCVDDCCPTEVACDDCCDADSCDGLGCDGCGDGDCDLFPAKLGFLDCLKDMELFADPCGDPALTLSAGGALRYRYYSEDNRLRPPGPGNNRQSNYSQWRFTPYVEANYKDRLTAHVEMIDASTFGNEIGILPIDENRWDLLEAYVDAKLYTNDAGTLGARIGRQRLLYGDQHVLSPLAWANTFRNFEGYKLYWKGENWDVDALIDMKSVNGPAGAPFKPDSFDTADQSRSLSGIYSTYKGLDKGKMDLYWLWANERTPGANRTDGDRHTFGARWYHTKAVKDECDEVARTWNYDVQGAYQIGSDIIGIHGANEQNVTAGFLNLMTSHTWNQATWTPTLTGLFYYGSGDKNLNDGDIDTVYTLYPLGHAYWGLADNFSGQNLIDYSLAMTVKPTKKLTLLTALHYFQKAEEADAIYNIANVALGGTQGTASRNIGSELDIVATYALTENITLQGGYFWFWYDQAVAQAMGGVPNGDSDTFYFFMDYKF